MAADKAPDTDAARRLGSALRALQQGSGCTLRDLETRVRISDSSLSRYFRGSTVPPWATVRDLCRALGADPTEYRTLWEAADRSQPLREAVDRGRAEPPREPSDPEQAEPPREAAEQERAEARTGPATSGRRLEPWRRIAASLLRTRRACAAAGAVLGAVVGALLTAVLLPADQALVGQGPQTRTAGAESPSGSGLGSSETERIFVSRATGACLDHSLDKQLRSYACNGMSYQRWTVRRLPDGTHRLRNHATGACLDHGERGLRALPCGSSASQKWSLTIWSDASAEVRSAHTDVCLDDSSLAGLRALRCDRTDRQKWG
ncbi:helix-turn-helix domain-containing protein [Streptomyces sp. NPDC051907]|uniref:helix-turn-helix domain-containing protein n=1 Tax=Streptomyces sp. NPDC051907 TaxID=3155284 RepID=UPI00342D6762